MVNQDIIRLKHMEESVDAILQFTQGKNRSNLDSERLLLSGILRELEIVGEAAGKISAETQNKFPAIPWKKLTGMRNRLIHAYFDIDHDVLWQTIQDFIPILQAELKSMKLNRI